VVALRTLPFTHLSLLSIALLSGCAGAIADEGASMVSSSSVWLRNTYDTDPSIYVGRFVPAGVTELDESNAMVLACSKHITTRFIDGGGVDYTEDMYVSTQVALKIGMPVVASGSAGYESSRTASAHYKLTGKIVAEIADPEAFAACCKEQPDQCTDRFIGEFIQGTGSLNHEKTRNLDLEGQGTNPANGLSGEGGVSRTAEWQRAAEFPNPVYFAFKVNPTPYTQASVSTCPSWVDSPPKADGGFYVVGNIDNQRSESAARDGAMRSAGGQAYQSTGIGVPVRPDSWCVSTTTKGKRVRYSGRVLGFISDAAVEDARTAARVAAEQAAAREAARLAAAQEYARLEAERAAANPQPVEPVTDPVTPAFDPVAPVFDPAVPGETPSEQPATGQRDVEKILVAIEAEIASSDMLSALKFSSRNASLTAAEAVTVLEEFGASSDKLEALTIMRDRISDPDNWQVLVEAFSFSDDREAARNLAP
jgi:hypothetical protein